MQSWYLLRGFAAVAAALLLVSACGQSNDNNEEQDGQADGGAAEEGDDGPCPGVPEKNRNKVVAKVGDTNITVCEVTESLNKMSPYLRKNYEAPAKRRKFIEQMVRFELLAQEAERRGYLEEEDVQRVEKQMMIQRLNKELQSSVTLADITEEEMREYYDEHQAEYNKAEVVRIARVLCKTQADCDRVLGLAKQKATDTRYFRELAREHSTDEETRDNGGDLPYVTRAADRAEGDPEVDEALVEAAFTLEMREPLYGKVIQTDDGFNVIRLRGRRKARNLSFEDVERQIKHRILREKLRTVREDLVTKLRKSADIEIYREGLSKVNINTPPSPRRPGNDAKAPGKAAPGGKKAPGPGKAAPGKGPAKGPAKAKKAG